MTSAAARIRQQRGHHVNSIFFYGSLRDRDLLEAVLGRPVDPSHLEPARVTGFAALRLATEAYPVLLPAPGRVAEGVIFHQPTEADVARLVFFEEAEYALMPITVATARGPVECRYFRGTDKPTASAVDWDFDAWCRDHAAVAIEATREYMHHFGRTPVAEIDTVWPGIKIRARQRARALAEEPESGTLRTGRGRADFETLSMSRAYTSFIAVQEITFRHRRFSGGWSRPVQRSVIAWGDVVTLLPYDPASDRLLVIEQVRSGPLARGDANPWCIEVVAGLIDSDENTEETARREAEEEAGLSLGRLERIGDFYTTPGFASERITAFVGEADLSAAGGVHGLEDEGEDIRSVILPFDEAMAAIAANAVNTGPALVSLLWLAANRDRLRAAWSR